MPSGRSMRAPPALLILAATLFAGACAKAEKRLFIIANNADGYGIDRCLANGAACGNAAATAYCRSHEFNQALSFRKVDRDDITGAIPTAAGPRSRCSHCPTFRALERTH